LLTVEFSPFKARQQQSNRVKDVSLPVCEPRFHCYGTPLLAVFR
jgi:hypothetical protein